MRTSDALATRGATVDVIAGDCNEDTIGTDLGTIAAEHGFVDVLTEVGNTDPTHPLARPSDDYAPLARLDHVLVRGAAPVAGRVVDAGVWDVDGPGDRMVEGLRRTGSDHLAVVADARRSGRADRRERVRRDRRGVVEHRPARTASPRGTPRRLAVAHGIRIGKTWNIPGLSCASWGTPSSPRRATKRRIGSRNISSPPQLTNVGGNAPRSASAVISTFVASAPCR